ncbi:hypothetical protein ABPG74_009799 [Tetrahymena malaccensis]
MNEREKRIEEIYILQQDIQVYVSIIVQRASIRVIITFLFDEERKQIALPLLYHKQRDKNQLQLQVSLQTESNFFQVLSSLIKYQSENANTMNVSKQTINWILQKINIQSKLETQRKRQNELASQLMITTNISFLLANFAFTRQMLVNRKKESIHQRMLTSQSFQLQSLY